MMSEEARLHRNAYRREYRKRDYVREREAAYMREYHKRPDAIARAKAQRDTPEAKAKTKARMERYRKRSHVKQRRLELLFHERLKKYGLTHEQFLAMFKVQDGRCAICGTDEFLNRGPQIDHEHSPRQKVRGILCNSCNGGLGLFRDNAGLLRAAADYLEAHNAC